MSNMAPCGSPVIAKDSGESLYDHLVNTARAAKIIYGNLPLAVQERIDQNDLLKAALFHDLGKTTVSFQNALKIKGRSPDYRHEILSAAIARAYSLPDSAIFAILTHHKPVDAIEDHYQETGTQTSQPFFWKKLVAELNDCWGSFDSDWEKICKKYGIMKLDLKSLALSETFWKIWVTNGEKQGFSDKLIYSTLRGILMSSDHIASGHNFNVPSSSPVPKINLTLRGFQVKSKESIGDMILRAPTGSGKTEAALLWANSNHEQNGRIFYVLPTITSINAMYKRLSEIYGEGNVGFRHSHIQQTLYDVLNDEKKALNLSSLMKELYYPVKISTPHQLLRFSLMGKGWETMLSEIQGSLIIFDEIHTYEPKIVGLTLATVKLLKEFGAKFAIASATIPLFLQKKIIDALPDIKMIKPDPGNSTDAEILNKKRHIFSIKDGSVLENINEILDITEREGGGTLVVCNSVSGAQEIYEKLKYIKAERYSGVFIKVLHSRYTFEDRKAKETDLERDNKENFKTPVIWVATQAVEVSLNVSFNRGYFEPAPMDALIQRSGRINRYGKLDPASIAVFRNEMRERSVYSKSLTSRSVDEISKMHNPVSEDDLISALDQVYKNGYPVEDEEDFSAGLNYSGIKDFKSVMCPGSYKEWTDQIIEQTDRTVNVLPNSMYERYKKSANWIEKWNCLIPLQSRQLAWLIRENRICKNGVIWMIKAHYDADVGLKIGMDDEVGNII